ncbi:DUF2938 family protein [Marinobacter algicola]|uniref:DUF2938 family protein n=1 Tax=Marinobacter algicola TaxID=236100 RepID=UPI000681EFFE|nr:DUF2938 family protein [Marinobacter algicola]
MPKTIAHRGQFHHDSIAASPPKRAEHIIGWAAHYLIGTAFAALLIGFWGESWIENPTTARLQSLSD